MQKIILQVIYSLTIFFLALTGFGQMPIFNRYHIADLPYCGWLGKFYITNVVHIIFAIVLTGLIFYIIFDNIFDKNKRVNITSSAYAKLSMLFVLIITGVLILIKNSTGTPFPPGFIIFINLTHVAFCIILLVYSLHTLLTKQKGLMKNL